MSYVKNRQIGESLLMETHDEYAVPRCPVCNEKAVKTVFDMEHTCYCENKHMWQLYPKTSESKNSLRTDEKAPMEPVKVCPRCKESQIKTLWDEHTVKYGYCKNEHLWQDLTKFGGSLNGGLTLHSLDG